MNSSNSYPGKPHPPEWPPHVSAGSVKEHLIELIRTRVGHILCSDMPECEKEEIFRSALQAINGEREHGE